MLNLENGLLPDFYFVCPDLEYQKYEINRPVSCMSGQLEIPVFLNFVLQELFLIFK